jgi:hypothetical protein
MRLLPFCVVCPYNFPVSSHSIRSVSYLLLLTHVLTFSEQSSSAIPAPLQVPPSRARRQFAMRLAQRKAQLESTREQEEDVEGDEETQEREVKEGHERFARMFEGIEDSSSDEDGDDEDDAQIGGKMQGLQLGGENAQRGKDEEDKEGVVVV